MQHRLQVVTSFQAILTLLMCAVSVLMVRESSSPGASFYVSEGQVLIQFTAVQVIVVGPLLFLMLLFGIQTNQETENQLDTVIQQEARMRKASVNVLLAC